MNPREDEALKMGVLKLVETLNNQPVTGSLADWNRAILFQIEDKENSSFEFYIKDKKFIVEAGRPLEPDIIVKDKEQNVLKSLLGTRFGDMKVEIPKGNKKKWTMKDGLEYGSIIGCIRQYINLPTTKLGEPNEIIEDIRDIGFNDIYKDVLKSIEYKFDESKVDYIDGGDKSILSIISGLLTQEDYYSTMISSGIMGNEFAKALRQKLEFHESVINDCKKYFEKLSARGKILNPNAFHTQYSSAASLVNDVVNIGMLVAIYATRVVHFAKPRLFLNVTEEMIEHAYNFFLYDLQRYIMENYKYKPEKDEIILDWKISSTGSKTGSARFILITNHRLVIAGNSKLMENIELLEGEAIPELLVKENGDNILKTNQRLFWIKDTFTGCKLFNSDLKGNSTIASSIFINPMKTLLANDDKYLYIWKEEAPMQSVELIENTPYKVTIIESIKKTLFVQQVIKKLRLEIPSTENIVLEFDEKEKDQILEYLDKFMKAIQ